MSTDRFNVDVAVGRAEDWLNAVIYLEEIGENNFLDPVENHS